ncbi:MAG: hypothetical protein Q4D98_05195 [Planctomycetia bacterium]|nr:hypothetical protein [Planctomycetia bacterium]
MKSERRRKLETNDLAGWLERMLDRSRQYHSTILITVLGLVLLVIAYSTYSAISRSANSNQWNEFYQNNGSGFVSLLRVEYGFQNPPMLGPNRQPLIFPDEMVARDAEVLDTFGKAHANKTVGQYALLEAGYKWLNDGAADVRANSKETAVESLKKAQEAFEQMAKTMGDANARQKACFGLAQTYEFLAAVENTDANLKAAVAAYKEVAGGNGVLSKQAADALHVLEAPSANSLYLAMASRASRQENMDDVLSGLNEPEIEESAPTALPEILPAAKPEETPAPAAEPAAEPAPAEAK